MNERVPCVFVSMFECSLHPGEFVVRRELPTGEPIEEFDFDDSEIAARAAAEIFLEGQPREESVKASTKYWNREMLGL